MTEDANVEIIEKRVKPSVIRRRKLVREVEDEPKEMTAQEAQEAVELPVEQVSAEDGELSTPEKAEREERKKEEDAQKEKVRVARIPKDKGKPARVIGRVELKDVTEVAPPADEITAPGSPPSAAEAAAETTPETAPQAEIEEQTAEREKKKPTWREREAEEEKPKKKFRRRREVVTMDEEGFEEAPIFPSRRTEWVPPAARTRRKTAVRSFQKPQITTPKAIKKVIRISEVIPVSDLAQRMGVKTRELLRKLKELEVVSEITDTVNAEHAALVAGDYGYEVESRVADAEDVLQSIKDAPENLRARPPVVTIMGHVDHGKTLLLDAVRKSHLVDKEAGGITQHIGAYKVELEKGTIVFIDTPGHEAFTAMRARGAQATDIVILVVAADDGVMPQTMEAIDHARAAHVPIIVAINKMDLPDANAERVKTGLSERGLVPEEWGGQTLVTEVSAKKKTGIDDLLELILLQAEMLDLKANPDKPARGVVIEARLDKGRGTVATVLVQEGQLKAGDTFVSGVTYGRLRAMLDEHGRRLKKAGPATPVEVVGFTEMPEAGDDFIVVPNEKLAKEASAYRERKAKGEVTTVRPERLSLEDFYEKIQQGEMKELRVILKGDTHGSLQAISAALEKLSTDEVKVDVIHQGVGGISETDVNLATASDAVVIGFNVAPVGKARSVAEREHVDLRAYEIIYELIEDVEKAIKGLLEPLTQEVFLGKAEVRAIFRISKLGPIAGSYVTDGKVSRGAMIRILRNGEVVHEGRVTSLKRFKEDVRDVQAGYECGIGVGAFNDWQEGDIIEAYTQEEVAR